MGNVPLLYDTPTTLEEWQQFSFVHAAHHFDMNSKIMQQFTVQLPDFLLDPIALNDPRVFLYQHQLAHNNIDAILNAHGFAVGGFDLSDVDLRNSDQAAGWIFLNASLHYDEATALETW